MVKNGFTEFFRKHYLFLVLALFSSLLLLIRGYGKFGNLFVDCGRDVVIPWRLMDGEVLYRDIWYVYGPLAPYLNLFLFKVFGVHLTTLYAAGIVTFFVVLALIYFTACRFLRREYSALIAVFFIYQLGLKQLHTSDIFNFVFPYSYGLIYGTAFSLWLLLFSLKYLSAGKEADLFLASIGLGGSLLSKGEIALSCLAYYIVFIVTVMPLNRKARAFHWARFLSAAFLLPASTTLMVFFYFTRKLDVFGYLHRQNFLQTDVWTRTMKNIGGMNDLAGSFLNISTNGGLHLLFLALLVILGFLSKKRISVAGLTALAAPVLAYLFSKIIDFREQYFSLSFIFIAAACFLVHDFLKGRRPFPLLLFLVFTVLFTGRRLLNCSTGHISFCILIPGLIFYFVFFLNILPGRFSTFAPGWPLVIFFLSLGLLNSYHAYVFTAYIFDVKNAEIRTPRGSMKVTNETFRVVNPLLRFLHNHVKNGEDLMVFPEGALINFLSGFGNSQFHPTFIPPDVTHEGAEASIIDYLERRRVGYVCIVGRRTDEYGFPVFGRDYLQELHRYLVKRYQTVRIFGAPPFAGPDFGAAVLKRKQ